MTADIINLRRVRKAKDRTLREHAAVANRARHGRSKRERAVQAGEADRAARILDGARLGSPNTDNDDQAG